MKVRRARQSGERIELTMTAMIDIVFLLLVFFVMTFKIVAPEGDFDVRMPVAVSGEDEVRSDIPPIKVRLFATAAGHLSGIRLGGRDLGRDFTSLNAELRQIVGDSTGPNLVDLVEVELDADYALRFEYVMDTITAVSGYRGPDGRVVKVCGKIHFAPPRVP